jgi:hypothetical protein
MSFFTLKLVHLVGPSGRVIVVNVQPQMIIGLRRSAYRAGLLGYIDARVVPLTSMGLTTLWNQLRVRLYRGA